MNGLTRLAAVSALILTSSTTADATQYFFQLANHPDGSLAPPIYGMRLDELYDVTPYIDRFTFDFNERAGTDMKLRYDDGGTAGDGSLGDDTVRIFGTVYGGLDRGLGYFGDPWLGYWSVDFTYRVNIVSGDDGANVRIGAEDAANNGSITPLFDVGGNTARMPILLTDKQGDHPYSFRFADNGYRLEDFPEYAGALVADGWLDFDGAERGDFLFTGTPIGEPVPEPGTVALFGLGLAGIGVLRRRSRRSS